MSPALAGGFLTTAPPGKPPERFKGALHYRAFQTAISKQGFIQVPPWNHAQIQSPLKHNIVSVRSPVMESLEDGGKEAEPPGCPTTPREPSGQG